MLAFIGLGPMELLILGGIGVAVLVCVMVAVVLLLTGGKSDRDRPEGE